jgi:deoxycytidine triphosphate deaminase
MSIKSDKWIRRMAAQGLIEPFEPGQVRTNAAGGRLISYGTSSYGYDVRCAREFKIFTNINSTIVDPKNFDEKSFVDVAADVCIIPPNSFALARTVEYFRIPRNVLTVCLGKCVTGDTRVVDADTGAYLPITEMRFGRSTLAWNGRRLERAKVSDFIPQGRREVFELRTRAGLRIRATANHPFLTLKKWVPLSDLRIGDRIGVAREIPVFGKTPIPDWEASLLGLMISEGQGSTPGHSPTCTTADQLNVGAADKFVPQSIFMASETSVRIFLQSLFSGDGSVHCGDNCVVVEYCSSSRRLIEDVHHLLLRFGIFSQIREKTTDIGTRACNIQIVETDQIRRFAERIGFVPGSIKQRVLDEEALPLIAANARCDSNFDTLPQEAWATIGMAACVGGYSLDAPGVRTQPNQPTPDAVARRLVAFTGDIYVDEPVQSPVWDTVEQIDSIGTEEVFDITVPQLHNFVANDFIVHNSTYARCGIIVNVTPLEPEWEGHVTLEFSNTTPLPARIYANEGVAQMLFFESDEVCETSYADRGGKYQKQRGVTLPKA